MSAIADLRAEVDRLKAGTSIVAIIGQTLPLKRAGRYLTALCPFHREKTASFCVYADHYHCFGCGARGDVFAWVMQTQRLTFPQAVEYLGGSAAHQPVTVRKNRTAEPDTPCPADDSAWNQDAARRIWINAVDPRCTPVETYLRNRGVRLPDEPVIRFHPRCPRKGGPLPAMVALMTDPATGAPSGVHRTFLTADGSGKATIEKPKMMLGRAGVIRLDEPIGEGIGLAEGIETSLSVAQRIGWRPVWAAGSRGGIERFPVLRGHCLTVFADGDAPGMTAARACAARWTAAGREVWIHAAPFGEDWNDTAARIVA